MCVCEMFRALVSRCRSSHKILPLNVLLLLWSAEGVPGRLKVEGGRARAMSVRVGRKGGREVGGSRKRARKRVMPEMDDGLIQNQSRMSTTVVELLDSFDGSISNRMFFLHPHNSGISV